MVERAEVGLPQGRVRGWAGPPGPAAMSWLPAGALAGCLEVEGLPLADLPSGTRLRVGATARLEVGDPGTASGGLLDVATRARTAARVVVPGPVGAGDLVDVESVAVPIEDALDLHPFVPGDVADVVTEYLAQAHAAGFPEVRLVHGRGRGVQRQIVRRLLAASPLVASFGDAPPERGGWGATVVRLRRGVSAAP